MSLSRDFGTFVAGLRYEDLPAAVVDRVKGVTLQAVVSALVGQDTPGTRRALAMMREDEAGGAGGVHVFGRRETFTKAGAAFVNSEMMYAGGKFDTYRMLTHPNIAIIPAAVAAAEVAGCSGKEFLAGVAAGYEVLERMASEFIPTVAARGFHPGPVFGIFGAAVAAAKIQGLDAEGIHSTIAQCVNLSAGNLEGARSGGTGLREGGAVRNALLAVSLAKHGMRGGETTLEGEAGFYHSYTGNNLGQLRYSFTADNRVDLRRITAGLGREWMVLETLYRIWHTAGYNIAHIEITAELCRKHKIGYADIERIEAVVNWLETLYPSPAFPTRGIANPPKPGDTQYFTAYGAVVGDFPLLANHKAEKDPPEVLELMKRVTLIPQVDRTLFGPRITIFTKDGRSVSQEGTGREFIWDYDANVKRIYGVVEGIAISRERFDGLIDGVRHLERAGVAWEALIPPTVPPDA